MFQLRAWQTGSTDRQFEILKSRGVVINVSSTGTGKTFMAADTARRLGLPVFVICPKSVLSTWKQVLADAGVHDAVSLNWEKLKTERHGFWKDGRWAFDREYFIILDEIHAGTTSPDSQITRMAALLKAFPSMPKLLLSATVADSPLQMRASGYLLGLHGYAEADFYAWCTRLGCEWAKIPNGRGGYVQKLQVPRAKYRAKEVMLRLRELMAPYMIRLSPDDVPGFPETVIESKLVDLDTATTAEIRRLYEPLANAHRTLSPDQRAQLVVARQRTEVLKVPVLAEMARDIVADGRSAVVFMNFREPLRLLAEALGPQNVVMIQGDQTDAQRQEAIRLFQDNERYVCLAQVQAGGVAVSLHDVKKQRPRTSLLCPDWDAKRVIQCLGRINRDGGTKTVQIFVLAAGTLEERVKTALDRKSENITTLNDGDLV